MAKGGPAVIPGSSTDAARPKANGGGEEHGCVLLLPTQACQFKKENDFLKVLFKNLLPTPTWPYRVSWDSAVSSLPQVPVPLADTQCVRLTRSTGHNLGAATRHPHPAP